MQKLIFSFREKTKEITREEVAGSMSVPLGKKRLSLRDREQVESVFDIVTLTPNFLTQAECDEVARMDDAQFEKLFTIIR
jgi:hypothetical protein